MITNRILGLLALTLAASSHLQAGDTMVQVSTIDALTKGMFDGAVSVGALKQAGDFGLGTLDNLDGELVALDGKYWQITADGVVHELPDRTETPFSAVTFFKADQEVRVPKAESLEELAKVLDAALKSPNQFYAVRIQGTFTIKLRSVAKQARPFPTLPEAVKSQVLFEFKEIRGTLVGFRCPEFAKGLNVVGYHYHFISDDLKAGGHVLACETTDAVASIDVLENFKVMVPSDAEFLTADFSTREDAAVQAAEAPVPANGPAPGESHR